MLGLATVLTERGMEGITAFVPPAAARAPKLQPEAAVPAAQVPWAPWAAWDAGTRRKIGIASGALLGLALVAGLLYALVQTLLEPGAPRAPRQGAVVRPVLEEAAAPAAAAADPASAAPAAPPQAATPQEVATPAETAKPPEAATPPAPPSASARPPRPMARQAPRRPASESVFAPQPEWSSQVRRIGEVDAQTERAAMQILEAIHAAQEREHPPRAPASREAGHE